MYIGPIKERENKCTIHMYMVCRRRHMHIYMDIVTYILYVEPNYAVFGF